MIHILVYMNRNPWYSLMEMEDFVKLGLSTDEEVRMLAPALCFFLIEGGLYSVTALREFGIVLIRSGCSPRLTTRKSKYLYLGL
jgi:hypothetical protein